MAGPSESGSLLRADGIRLVKLSDGTTLSRVLLEQDGTLLQELGGCGFQGWCEQLTTSFIPPGETVESHDHAPGPREGYAAALSARRAAVRVLGGVSAEDGGELHDVWGYDLDEGHWCPLGGHDPPPLGRVLAATYSAVHDALWLLDEVPLIESIRRWFRRTGGVP